MDTEEARTSTFHPHPSNSNACVPGYAKLCYKMGTIPELSCHRSFGAIRAEMIFHVGFELETREAAYRACQRKEYKEQDKSHLASSLQALREADEARSADRLVGENSGSAADAEASRPVSSEQLKMLRDMQEPLFVYTKLVLDQEAMGKLESPDEYVSHFIEGEMMSKTDGRPTIKLQEAKAFAATEFPDDYARDLVVVKKYPIEDPFSSWITQKVVPYFGKRCCSKRRTHDKHHDMEGHYDESIQRKTRSIVTVLAPALLVAPIVVLNYVQSMGLKIGLIAVFNVVFSFCLLQLAGAKRSEILTGLLQLLPSKSSLSQVTVGASVLEAQIPWEGLLAKRIVLSTGKTSRLSLWSGEGDLAN